MATLHFLKEAAHIPLGYIFIPKLVSRFFFIGQGMLSERSNFKFHLVSKQLNIIQRSCKQGTRLWEKPSLDAASHKARATT